MENASNRLLRIIKKTNVNTISEYVTLTIRSLNPLEFTDGDKLVLPKQLVTINSMIDKQKFTVGDKFCAITLNDGQLYYIIDVVNSTNELMKYKTIDQQLQDDITALQQEVASLKQRISTLESFHDIGG